MGPALQGIFVGQGPCALPGVRGKTGRRGEGTPPYGVRGKECLRYRRADRGVRPYGWFARSLWGGRPRGSPLRTGTRNACVDRGRGRTPPLRSARQGVPWAGRCRHRPLRRCGREMPAWNPPVSFADSPLEERGARGRGLRIATTSVRTGLAMTHHKECSVRRDTWVPPYKRKYFIYSCARQIKNTDHFRRNKT